MKEFKIGTDIECFIVNNQNKAINAFNYVKGTKEFPFEWKRGFFTSLDCVLMEYNTPPTTELNIFKRDILDSISYLNTLIEESKSLHISFFPSYELSEDQLFNPESKIFGCTPDFNAWTENINSTVSGDDTNLRSAGLHLHFDCNPEDVIPLIKNLDMFLGIPALVLEPENERRNIYGKAGAFRETRYGCEYRHLSSWFQQEQYLDFIFKNSKKAFEYTQKGFVADRNIESIINNKDLKTAKEIIKEFNLLESYNQNQ